MIASSAATPVISLPRLVLRVAFAGNRSLPAGALVSSSLSEIWRGLGQRLVEIAPCAPAITAGREPAVSAYFSTEKPLLRLITGLAEGADALAWQTLQGVSADATHAFAPHLDLELAAVLPCPLPDYRGDREKTHLPVFDTQVTQCAYLTELDGIIFKDGLDLSKERRSRAFRAQSAILLRQADFLVAVADPSAPGKPGGTLETIRNALDFDLPVIFVHAVTGDIRLLDAIEDLAAAFASPPAVPWQTTLRDWTTKIIADPDTSTPDEPARPGKIVIAIVSFDILALLADVCGLLPYHISHNLHAAAPWLVFLTALLPAAVAGLNAIRFQSECRRLADRSDFMVKVLTGRRTQLTRLQNILTAAQANPATNPASWTPESLRLAELIAADFAQEVSEWSVLYGKEVHEP